MTKPLITAEQAIQALRLVVAEKGEDHVYQAPGPAGVCVYVDPMTHEPSCLVAHALFKIGVPLSELRAWEGNSARAMVPGTVTVTERRTKADGLLTADAGAILDIAQDAQDKGAPWGVALAEAESEYRFIAEQEGQA